LAGFFFLLLLKNNHIYGHYIGINIWAGYKIIEKSIWDMDLQTRSSVGGSGGILPQHVFNL